MKTANSFKISANCWRLSIKAVFAQMLTITLTVALCFMLFSEIVNTVATLVDSLNLADFVGGAIESIAEGQFDVTEFATKLGELVDSVTAAIESIPNIFNRIEASYIVAFVLFCLYRMLNSSSDITIAYSFNEFMTTNAKRPFIWYFFKKAGKSFSFVMLQFLISFLLDLVIIFAVSGFYLVIMVAWGWWMIIPTAVIAVAMYSVRITIFSFWLPSIATNDSGVVEGLKDGFRKLPGHFWSIFLQVFVTLLAISGTAFVCFNFLKPQYAALISAAVFFIGFFLIKSFNIVQYFEANQIPYFTTRVNLLGTTNKKSRHSKSVL